MKPSTFNPDKLRALREAHQWSYQDVVTQLAILKKSLHPDTIKNWEEELTYPGADDLAYLARLFGVAIQEFYTNGG